MYICKIQSNGAVSFYYRLFTVYYTVIENFSNELCATLLLSFIAVFQRLFEVKATEVSFFSFLKEHNLTTDRQTETDRQKENDRERDRAHTHTHTHTHHTHHTHTHTHHTHMHKHTHIPDSDDEGVNQLIHGQVILQRGSATVPP